MQPRSHNPIAYQERVAHIHKANIKRVQWEDNPKHIEKDQVYPKEHEIARIEVLISRQPFRGKGHEAYPCTSTRFSYQDVLCKIAELTSIELRGSKNNHPERRHRIPHADLITDPQRQRPSPQDRQQLQTHNRQVRATPPPIRLRIHHPQLRRPVVPISSAIQPIGVAEEIDDERGMVGRGIVGGGGEEAVVQERSFEDGVDEEVEGVPDEENAEAGGGRWGEHVEGEEVGGV